MRHIVLLLSLLLFGGLLAEEHPRILATPDLLAKLTTEFAKPDSHHAQARQAMLARLEMTERDPYIQSADKSSPYYKKWQVYAIGYRAREAAFIALTATDPTERRRFADLAFESAKKISYGGNKGLEFAMGSMSLSLAYDWGRPAYTPEQRAWFQDKAAGLVKTWQGVSRNMESGNKMAVEFGCEIICNLAAGTEQANAKRLAQCKQNLLHYIDQDLDDVGLSEEGLGYTEYPAHFWMLAMYGLRSIGDNELFEAARKLAYGKLALYAYNFQTFERKYLMFGVSHTSNADEGFCSMLLPLVSEDQLPYVLHWYDRRLGLLGVDPLPERFERDRGFGPLSVMCYPVGVTTKDPTGQLPPVLRTDHDLFMFRRRWQDADDILFSIAADSREEAGGWDHAMATSWNLMGYDTRFVGGPGKGKSEWSKLLVGSGKGASQGSPKSVGKLAHFEERPDGGYVVVDGGPQYEELGATGVKRHVLVSISDNNTAVIGMLDEGTSPKGFTWMANPGNGDGAGLDGVELSQGTESGREFFLLKGRNDGFTKGWILNGGKLELKDPMRIEGSDFFVVLYVGKGQAPKAQISGSGLTSTIIVAGRQLRFTGGKLTLENR